MPAIAVPYAPLWAQIVCGIPLALIAFLGLAWGGKNLWLSLKILRGLAPPRPGATRLVSGILGLVFHGLVVAVALGSGFFLCALLTTQPTLITESGVVTGAGPPKYRASFIPWREITRVQCRMSLGSNVIQSLVLRSSDEVIELGSAGVPLEPVRAFITQHTRAGTVRPCEHDPRDSRRFGIRF
jgi:hypothetical protein